MDGPEHLQRHMAMQLGEARKHLRDILYMAETARFKADGELRGALTQVVSVCRAALK